MVASKRAIHIFNNAGETGVWDIPDGALVLIEATFELYFKVDNIGLDPSMTVQDAITRDKLVTPDNTWHSKNDGPDSGLSAEFWGGHRLIEISTSEPTAADGVTGDIWFQRDA